MSSYLGKSVKNKSKLRIDSRKQKAYEKSLIDMEGSPIEELIGGEGFMKDKQEALEQALKDFNKENNV